MNADDWGIDDPLIDPDDPEAQAREQRRRERESRRRERATESTPAPAAPTAERPKPAPRAESADGPPRRLPPRRPQAQPPSGRGGRGRIGFALLVVMVMVGAALLVVAGAEVLDRVGDSDEPAPAQTLQVEDLTIPEGYDRRQVAEIAKDAGLRGDYLQASVSVKGFDPQRYGDQGRARNLEGFLFPATYELERNTNVKDLVTKQLVAFEQNIAGVNMRYARSKNLTRYDVLIIASMIEREVQVPRERRLVAAVIYNRLHDGMPLGIDATTRFAVGNFTTPLTPEQLDDPSPYNTRLHAGLPPGPIGNPGLAAIEAAARPANVDYLFYVVKPGTCGEHSFSSSEAQFLRDADAYQQALEEEGGSPTSCPG